MTLFSVMFSVMLLQLPPGITENITGKNITATPENDLSVEYGFQRSPSMGMHKYKLSGGPLKLYYSKQTKPTQKKFGGDRKLVALSRFDSSLQTSVRG